MNARDYLASVGYAFLFGALVLMFLAILWVLHG